MICCGAPGVTRTPDLLVRSQTLYPAELRAHRGDSSLSIYRVHADSASASIIQECFQRGSACSVCWRFAPLPYLSWARRPLTQPPLRNWRQECRTRAHAMTAFQQGKPSTLVLRAGSQSEAGLVGRIWYLEHCWICRDADQYPEGGERLSRASSSSPTSRPDGPSWSASQSSRTASTNKRVNTCRRPSMRVCRPISNRPPASIRRCC